MRSDMAQLIVDMPKWGSGWIRGIKTRGSIVHFIEIDDYDDIHLPNRLGRRARYYDNHFCVKEQREDAKPFYRFLESQVGRKWDEVYSDIRFVADGRSYCGSVLLRIIASRCSVKLFGKGSKYHFGSDPFFVDENGILQRSDCDRKREEKLKPITEIYISPLLSFEKRDGIWYEVKYQKHLGPVVLHRTDPIMEEYLCSRDPSDKSSDFFKLISRQQLGKKKLKLVREILSRERTRNKNKFRNPIILLCQNHWDNPVNLYVAPL